MRCARIKCCALLLLLEVRLLKLHTHLSQGFLFLTLVFG